MADWQQKRFWTQVEIAQQELGYTVLLDGRLVSEHRLARARDALRRQPRIRLRAGASLPAGAEVVREELDGMLVIETADDPMRWLHGLPEDTVESAEVGIDRLEDLYQLLLADSGGDA